MPNWWEVANYELKTALTRNLQLITRNSTHFLSTLQLNVPITPNVDWNGGIIMLTLTQSNPLAMPEAGADSGIERRRGLRIQQNRPIKVYEHTASRYFGGQTQDVSSTGLR